MGFEPRIYHDKTQSQGTETFHLVGFLLRPNFLGRPQETSPGPHGLSEAGVRQRAAEQRWGQRRHANKHREADATPNTIKINDQYQPPKALVGQWPPVTVEALRGVWRAGFVFSVLRRSWSRVMGVKVTTIQTEELRMAWVVTIQKLPYFLALFPRGFCCVVSLPARVVGHRPVLDTAAPWADESFLFSCLCFGAGDGSQGLAPIRQTPCH